MTQQEKRSRQTFYTTLLNLQLRREEQCDKCMLNFDVTAKEFEAFEKSEKEMESYVAQYEALSC